MWALIAFFVLTLTGSKSYAGCVNAAQNERLANFCLVQRTNHQSLTFETAQIIDFRLKREGYTDGLGLPVGIERFSFQPYVTPILNYETDINGGNPSRPLQLGSLTFTGNPELVREEGVVLGAGVGANGRYITGQGRYIDYSFGVSYAHSFEHDIGIQRRFASICSRNHLTNWWYLDGCANSSYVEKDLTEATRNALSLTTSKLFTSSANNHHQASIGVNRIYDEDYQQNQLVFGFQTIHRNGWHSALNATLGESIDGEIAVREALSASLSLPVSNRRLTLSANYSEADGARLLGFERAENTWSVSATYSFYENIDVSIGYVETNSTIDYFDVSTPTIGINFRPIRF